MNKLLYLVSLDLNKKEDSDTLVKMTRKCIKTIRSAGNYNGDIILLTYESNKYDDFNINIVTPEKQCQTYSEVILYKFKARKYINDSYDSILYLDTDIIAINDINPIFDLPDNNILFAEEFPINFITNIDFLTEPEKQKAEKIPRINAGTFVCDGNIYHEYMEKMENYVKEANEKELVNETDQLPLTAMILRGHLNYDNIPHRWVEFPLATKTVGPPPVIDEDTKLLHLLGHKYDSSERLKHIQKCNELIQQEQYREINEEYSP